MAKDECEFLCNNCGYVWTVLRKNLKKNGWPKRCRNRGCADFECEYGAKSIKECDCDEESEGCNCDDSCKSCDCGCDGGENCICGSGSDGCRGSVCGRKKGSTYYKDKLMKGTKRGGSGGSSNVSSG